MARKLATPVMAWAIVTERGRIILGSLHGDLRRVKGCGFPSDRVTRVLVTELPRRKARGRGK